MELHGNSTQLNAIRTNNGDLTIGRAFTSTTAFTNNGTLTLDPNAVFTAAGTFTQMASGRTEFQLGGAPASGLFGKLSVAGTAALMGTAAFVQVQEYGAKAGDVFPLATFGSKTGQFDAFDGDYAQRTRVFDPVLSATTFVLNSLVSTADLAVTSVTPGAGSLLSGDDITVDYTVTNFQDSPTFANEWVDSIYLSLDDRIDPGDKLIGRVTHTGFVDANGSYSGSITVPLPGVLPGDYRVLVVTDSRGLTPDSDRSNNAFASSPIITDIRSLTSGVVVNGTVQAGQDVWYRIDLPAGKTQGFDFTSTVIGGAELYLNHVSLPSLSDYDKVLASSQQTVFSTTLPVVRGTTYLLVHGTETAGAGATFTLSAKGLDFGVFALDHDTGALGAGTVTTTIHGSLLTPGTTYSLIPDVGTPIAAQQVYYLDSSTAWATFDLTNAVAGTYDIRADDGGTSATLPDAYHVIVGKGGDFEFSIYTPSYIRPPFRNAVLTFDYENTGFTDVPAPLMLILAQNTLLKLPDDPAFGNGDLQFLAVNPDGPAGILQPGSRGRIEIEFVPVNQSAHAKSKFVALVSNGADFTFQWDEMKDSFQPPNIPDDAWSAIFSNFKTQVGDNAETLRTALADDATRLSQMGIRTASVAKLIGYELEEADNFGAISQRYEIGALGRGQAGPFSMHAITELAGTVTIVNGDQHRIFFKNGSSFKGANGDPGVLTRDVNGALHLRQFTGEEVIFRASDGRLDRFLSANGFQTTVNYDISGQIVGAVDGNGDTVAFTYNPQGRIATVTDAVGKVTIIGYDASGEHLTSIVTSRGTTSLTYVTGQGPALDHAVASITFRDGTSVFYQYDTRGRLINAAGDGGALATSFAYDATGGMSATNLLGDTTTSWHVPGGSIGQTFHANGLVSSFLRNGDGDRVYGFTDGTSLTVEKTEGHLTLTNSLGQKTNYDIGGSPLRANSLTNPNGYATTFDHDNFGNLTAIIGPDGGTLHFTYDGHGNRTTFINERGQLIGYTYDAHDLLTRKNLPDGTHVDYAYDAHRNLTSASMRAANNADLGTTSYEYNAQDRMTKVTYPGGKFLDFTYDAAGRRATVSDGTFTERYAYDALGRLARVSDTAAATLIAYTYDSVGRLATETRGNGTTTAYAYDSLGRNTSIVHRAPDNSVTESFAYTYDAGNHVLTSTTLNGTTTYGYDLTGQLNRVELPGGRIINYAYDANGNRKTVNDTASGTEYYTTNILDEYSATDGATFLYDADGNLVRKNTAAGSTLYQYDASGRLAQTSGPDGTTTYLYDALGNRIATTKDGVRTDYLIDPAGYGNVFAEYDNGGNLVAHYAHGLGLASRVDAGGAAKFYHYDITGNTQLLTANDGSVQATYEYLPFGEKIGSTGTAENAYTFNGRFGVEDRGDGLYDMRARSYDPEIGRFTQQDPLNVLAGDTNLYRYVNNNPVSFVDPTGLVLTEAALLAEQLAAYEAAFAEAALLAEQLAAYKAAFASAYAGSELAAAEAAALLAESAAPVLVAAAAETTVVAGTTTAVVGGTTTAVSGTTTAAAVVTTAVALPTALAGTLILGGTDIALRIFAPDLHDAGTQAVGDAFFGDAQDVINHETENHILDEHRAPQVQKYIDKIAADPANPTIEELSRAERLARFEAELATYNRARLLHELYPDVYPDPGPEPSLTSSSEVILPNDPNNILGPSGSGADQIADDPETQPFRFDGFVRPTGLLGYTILFENKPSASAPAQQVIVTQTLDADLDISTFRFGSFGWGDFKVTAPADASGTTFHQRVDATATLGIFVDVDATLNVNTHELRVVFTSLDATTLDLPLDPFAGFLPANITPPEGDGFVTYRVEPKADLPNRTRIDGLATIIFDTEAAINTPLIHNLIDSAAPVSNITPFARATTSRNVFRVNWTASDDAGGSGLADVGIYYTDNDGPLQALIVATAGGDFRFGGETGHTYKFFSIAHDEVGNTEAFAQANPDATISVIAPTLLPVGKKRIFFDADGDKYTVKYSGPGTANIVLLDPDGDGKGSIDQIFVDGTPTTKSKLSVTVKKNKNGGDGIVNIGDLTVAGSLGSFSAKQSNIIVNGITATGTIKSIAIRDLLREDPFLADPLSGGVLTEITLGGINVDKTAITARTIADGFALSTPGTVTLFNAASIGDGAITARALGKLTTTLGAMNADLTIAGAVGSVTIKGGVNVSQWTVGSIGAVTIGGSLEGDIDASGLVKSVTVKNGALNGQVTGATIGAVSVTGGGFGGFIGSSAAPGKVKGLGSLTITGGDLTGSVLVNGNSGPITVRESKAGIGGNISGPITANSFGAITLLGGGLSGALNATGTALALGKTLALAKLTVTGGDLLADVRLFGGAGAISVKSDKLGNGGNINDINITAAKIAALSVARDITDSIIMAGADLGADHELGGGDDAFAAGSIGKVIVGRNVATSTIGAGLSTTNAILKDGDDTILGGVASAIAGLIVK